MRPLALIGIAAFWLTPAPARAQMSMRINFSRPSPAPANPQINIVGHFTYPYTGHSVSVNLAPPSFFPNPGIAQLSAFSSPSHLTLGYPASISTFNASVTNIQTPSAAASMVTNSVAFGSTALPIVNAGLKEGMNYLIQERAESFLEEGLKEFGIRSAREKAHAIVSGVSALVKHAEVGVRSNLLLEASFSSAELGDPDYNTKFNEILSKEHSLDSIRSELLPVLAKAIQANDLPKIEMARTLATRVVDSVRTDVDAPVLNRSLERFITALKATDAGWHSFSVRDQGVAHRSTNKAPVLMVP